MFENNQIKNYSIRYNGGNEYSYYNIALIALNGVTRVEHYFSNNDGSIERICSTDKAMTVKEIRNFLHVMANSLYEPIFVSAEVMLPDIMYKEFNTMEIILNNDTFVTYILHAKYDDINNTETYTLKQVSTDKVLYEGSCLKRCYDIIGKSYTTLSSRVWEGFEVNGLYEVANRRETADLY